MGSTAVVVSKAGGRQNYDDWRIITSLVLDGLSSRHKRRAYSQALDEFLIWFRDDPGREVNKAAVQRYRAELEIKAWRLPALTSACPPSAASLFRPPTRRDGSGTCGGLARARGAKRGGVRLGHWLTLEQAEQFLALPDLTTLKGNRDGAVLAFSSARACVGRS